MDLQSSGTGWEVDLLLICAAPPVADGTETASLFASLGTEVLPDEDLELAEAEEGRQNGAAAAAHGSDRDDYSSDGDGDASGRPGPSTGRLRHRSCGGGNGDADGGLAAAAGVRAEALLPAAADQQDGGGGEAGGAPLSGQKGDAKILRELFEGSGVRGAIDHSKVEGEKEAGKVVGQ